MRNFFFSLFFSQFTNTNTKRMNSSTTTTSQTRSPAAAANEQQKRPDIFYQPNNLSNYYEYRVYDRNICSPQHEREYRNYEYSPCTILLISRHQGFIYNEELFVNAYRRSAGYECHKSPSLVHREEKIKRSTGLYQQQQEQDNQGGEAEDMDSPPEVIDIHLTEADRDVWP